LCVGLVLVLMGLASEALAGGFWLPGRGVGPLGRAGAVVASASDPNAIWYNPAALTEVDGHELLIDVAVVTLNATFERADATNRNGDLQQFEEVENEGTPQWVPQILFSTDFGRDDMALGAGFYAPYAPRYRFPEDGPQRYALIDNTKSIIFYQHLAFAYKPHPAISIGAGIQNMMAVIDVTTAASSYIGLWGEPEDQDLDLLFRVHGQDFFTITGNAGIWSEPVEGLKLGTSVQFPATVLDEEAEITVRLPTHYAFDNASLEGDSVRAQLELPWIIRAGISYGIEKVFDVEVAMTYETWSVHKRIITDPNDVRVTNVPTLGDLEVGPLNIERQFEDTLSVHVGGDWHVLPDTLTVRAGLMYEQGAIPDKTYSVFQVDSDKIAPTVGLSWMVEAFRLDVAYSFIYQFPKDIEDSEVAQINPTYEDGATIVGNGSYSSFFNVFGVGASYTF